ncbi:anthranilate synthase component I family protein [Candidatus Poribacteria bacterium]|nr:anthranilate synthase component I family protein [Candidatus Poribacteria bacterium]
MEATAPVTPPPIPPLPGSAAFWRSDAEGWCHPPLILTSPLLLLRVSGRGTRVETPAGELVEEHDDPAVTPFHWLEEILESLAAGGSGTDRRPFARPIFPIAAMCVNYEYGRFFNPYEHCFPHAPAATTDDILISFHTTGFCWKDGRWSLVGRPPGRETHWRKWRVPREAGDWPKPPAVADATPLPQHYAAALAVTPEEEPVARVTRAEYESAVERIHGHLAAGDIYQANLTVRFDGRTRTSAEDLFAAGIASGGERYAALVHGPGYSHVSFSPELLFRKWGRSITTTPIQGTRPRGGSPEEDGQLSGELLASAKDRAEHIMIVDLERSDIGRLCEYGSVRADPVMELTTHPTVHHLESVVTGTLRTRVTLRDIFTALFPGGSVTGAPKRRALEVIASLENRPREIYCGAMGWVDSRGDAEFNLPIRTATLHHNGRIRLYAGGAIVADSTAGGEWDELNQKLAFMRNALSLAFRSAGAIHRFPS